MMAAFLLAAATPGAMAWVHHIPCHKVSTLTPSEFRAAVHVTLCLDLPEIVNAVRANPEFCSCCRQAFATPAHFAAHALSSERKRPDGGGSVYSLHNAMAYTIQRSASHAGVSSFVGGAMCRAGSGPDDHPIHADSALTGLATGAVDGDRELRDVTVQNFVGGNLNILHGSDADPHGVIRFFFRISRDRDYKF